MDCFDRWKWARPPILDGKGEVARFYNECKMCPCCRFVPITHFQTDDVNAKQMEIPYPFGFKDYDTPVFSETEFDKARMEQLNAPLDEYQGVSSDSDSEEEYEEMNNRQGQQDAILNLTQEEETLSSADFRGGFRFVMEYGVYGVPLHLRLCYYRALLREEFHQRLDWTSKQIRLNKIARLARHDIFICRHEAKDDDTIRDFCMECVQALRSRRKTRENIDQRLFWMVYAHYFHQQLKVRRFVNLVED
jgi:hypothetical protein